MMPESKHMPLLTRLECGSAICTLAPEIGGSVVQWQVGTQPMLRTASEAAVAAKERLGLASFPLVPYSNRIGNGRFDWQGKTIQLQRNFPPEPHSIHGTGWEDVWDICEKSHSSCTMTLTHPGDARWPWPFTATQAFTLGDASLELCLRAQNLANEAVPLAFGHHPYFDQAGACLTFEAAQVWTSGDDALPIKAVAPTGDFDFADGAVVAGRSVDHCYAGWNGRARIDWKGRPHALEIVTDMPAAVVYIPCGDADFCFEPVPHLNNALNMAGEQPGMLVIAPGDTYQATIRLQAVRHHGP